MTYNQARKTVLEYLARMGWNVHPSLKFPRADFHMGNVRLYFKARAIHATTYGESMSTARTLYYDLDVKYWASQIELGENVHKALVLRARHITNQDTFGFNAGV